MADVATLPLRTPERPIPLDVLERMLGIVGMTGSGKTYTAKGGVEQLLRAGRRVVIVDPLGVWWGLRLLPDGHTPSGLDIPIFGGDHQDFPIEPEQGRGVARILDEARTSAILDISGFSKEEQTEFLEGFTDELYNLNKVHRSVVYLVIDEADEFAPQQGTKEEKPLFRSIDRIVRRGRIMGFRVMMITQRPAALHKNVLTQCQSLIAMALNAEQDRKAIEGWVKGQPDATMSREVVRTLGQLQTGEGWLYAPRLHLIDRGRFPQLTTFDSSSTPEHGEDLVDVAVAKLDMGALAEAMAKLGKGGVEEDTRDERIAFLEKENGQLRRQVSDYQRGVDWFGRRVAEIGAIVARTLEPPADGVYPTADEENAGRRRMVVEVVGEHDAAPQPFPLNIGQRLAGFRVEATAGVQREAGPEDLVPVLVPPTSAKRIEELPGGPDHPAWPWGPDATDPQVYARQVQERLGNWQRAFAGAGRSESAAPPSSAPATPPETLPAAARQVVDAFAVAHPHALTFVQAGRIAGAATSGQGWSRKVAAIQRSGLVQTVGADGFFGLTEAGVALTGAHQHTRASVRDALAALLSEDAREMLRAAVAAPGPMTRPEIAKASGVVSPTSSRLYALLQELLDLGLIERTSRTQVAATEIARG